MCGLRPIAGGKLGTRMIDDSEWDLLASTLGLTDAERARLRALAVIPLVWHGAEGFVLQVDGTVARYEPRHGLVRERSLRLGNGAIASAARFVPQACGVDRSS